MNKRTYIPVHRICADYFSGKYPVRTEAEIDAYAAEHGWMRATEFLAENGIVIKYIHHNIDDICFVDRVDDRSDMDRVELMYDILHRVGTEIRVVEDNRSPEQRAHDARVWEMSDKAKAIMIDLQSELKYPCMGWSKREGYAYFKMYQALVCYVYNFRNKLLNGFT